MKDELLLRSALPVSTSRRTTTKRYVELKRVPDMPITVHVTFQNVQLLLGFYTLKKMCMESGLGMTEAQILRE